MATDPENREDVPSTVPLPSLTSAPQTIMTLPFPFPVSSTQILGPSVPYFPSVGTSTTSPALQPEHILQFQTLLASLQATLAQQSVPTVPTANASIPRPQFTMAQFLSPSFPSSMALGDIRSEENPWFHKPRQYVI